MSRTTRRGFLASAFALGVAVTALISPAAHAASIAYGNFGPVPPGISFLGVTESSGTDPVPLYGPPTPFSVGLDFDPTSFVATANGGGADITDGQLNFMVKAGPGQSITGLGLTERGDYTLVGVGTPATSVFAGAVILASVAEINGVPVAPIALPASNASVGFNLVANPGIVQPWALGTSISVPAALGNVTKINIAINNSLVALSEPGSIAFIAKKDFVITVTPGPGVPEPGAVVLAGLGLCGLGITAARKRG